MAVEANAPPGPRGLPLLGVAPRLIRDPLGFCTRMAAEYGGVVRLPLGLTDVYMLSRPEDVKRVLQDNSKNYGKGKSWEAMRKIIGNAIPTADGEYWLKQRRTMQPGFHKARLRSLVDLMVESITARLDAWQAYVDSGKSLDVHEEMKNLTLHTMLATMFSTSLDANETRELDAALPALVAGIGTAMWASFLPAFLPVPGKRKFRRAVRTIDRIVQRVLEERRTAGGERDDLLGMLLAATDPETGERMDDRQLRDEFVGLFIAAFETTSLALTWTVHALCLHPHVEQRLRDEVRDVLGNRRPTSDDLGRLACTRAAFEESMRVYPPGWVIPRQATDSDIVGGYLLPPGAIVLICSFLTHRDPDAWDRPGEFDIDRFLGEQAKKRPREAFIPFGLGPRQCIGSSFATMESVAAIACLLQRYRFRARGSVRQQTVHVTVRPEPAFEIDVAPIGSRQASGRAG